MTKIPLTRVLAEKGKAEAIRAAVRAVRLPDGAPRKLAQREDAEPFYDFIRNPAVSESIYTLPKPVTLGSTSVFIERHIDEQARGEGLLMLDIDEAGVVVGYHDIQFWPEWSACELGGAIHPDRQNKGEGGKGAAMAFSWLFEMIGVDLICETAALDNIRTAHLLERLGFVKKGIIESELPGGGKRPSSYWEMTKAAWQTRKNEQQSLAHRAHSNE
jgi:RimJ/RimL family protein N-acetyltransferase